MDVDLNLAVILDEICVRNQLRGDVLALGARSIGLNATALERALRRGVGRSGVDTLQQHDLFSALGFASSSSLGGEGADFIFDLNLADTPDTLRNRFDVVLNCSTLEHVFHLPNALAHMTRMLKPGGTVIHVMPCNNWVDHGFYQFGPTLLFDYYRAAKFTALEAILIAANLEDRTKWFVHPLHEGQYDTLSQRFEHCACMIVFVARANHAALDQPVPIQRIYDDQAPPPARTHWFQPYRLNGGITTRPHVIAEMDLQSRMQAEQGFAWAVDASDISAHADSAEAPHRSTLIVLEDGLPIGPPHSAHADIRARGAGRYSHWGDTILFSTSDNRPPSATRRSYVALLTTPVEEMG